jgi:hypothetical protein
LTKVTQYRQQMFVLLKKGRIVGGLEKHGLTIVPAIQRVVHQSISDHPGWSRQGTSLPATARPGKIK